VTPDRPSDVSAFEEEMHSYGKPWSEIIARRSLGWIDGSGEIGVQAARARCLDLLESFEAVTTGAAALLAEAQQDLRDAEERCRKAEEYHRGQVASADHWRSELFRRSDMNNNGKPRFS